MEFAIKEEVPWSSDSEKQKCALPGRRQEVAFGCATHWLHRTLGLILRDNICSTIAQLTPFSISICQLDLKTQSSLPLIIRRDGGTERGIGVPCVTRPPLRLATVSHGFGSEEGSDSSCPILKKPSAFMEYIYVWCVYIYVCVCN